MRDKKSLFEQAAAIIFALTLVAGAGFLFFCIVHLRLWWADCFLWSQYPYLHWLGVRYAPARLCFIHNRELWP